MGLIDRAARRLQALERAGVPVNWALAGLDRPDGAATGPNGAAGPAMVRGGDPLVLEQVPIDLAALGAAGFVVPDAPPTPLSEAFRRIKRPLLDNARGRPDAQGRRPWHVAITSALPGEGKTFSALNLALSLAMEVDTAVLLVDADVVRASLFDRLGITAERPGLLDLLADEALRPEQALLATSLPGLKLLGPGRTRPGAAEWLASDAMERLLSRLDTLLPDHVLVFDLPPLVPTTESAALAARAGQVVLVAHALRTPRPAFEQALAMLAAHPLVLTLLNRDPDAERHGGYGYHAAAAPTTPR